MSREIRPIGYIKTAFPTKFGIPRQAGLVSLTAEIVLNKEFSDIMCIRGIEDYSHLWVIWDFSDVPEYKWQPTVRPPRLGGNKRVGVFATRSPYRPNPIGLSSGELVGVSQKNGQTVICVRGADMKDGTPVYDIKPYLAYTDSHPQAVGGFSDAVLDYSLKVVIPKGELKKIPDELHSSLYEILSEDPRPSYQKDESRVYGFRFSDYEIKFTVVDNTLTVKEIKYC